MSSLRWSTRCGLSWECVDSCEGHVLPAAEPREPGVCQVPTCLPMDLTHSVSQERTQQKTMANSGGGGTSNIAQGPKSTSIFKN